jgi:integrase
MEANSLETFGFHKKHLLRILGSRTGVQGVTVSEMQRYVNARSHEEYRGKLISPRTIKKEIATFRAVWNWGVLHSRLTGHAPVRGLKYEKESEKLPFMTWDEIETRVQKGGLDEEAIASLWDRLFLDTTQIEALLAHVKEHAARPFIYPMFVFVAHTGARRSEMIRSTIDDIDFEGGQVMLREKKKSLTKKLTFRKVPMSDRLKEALDEWLTHRHPGGPHTFCRGEVTVARKRKKSEQCPAQAQLSTSDATHYFNHTLAGSKWAVVRGFHVFRHSFSSNLARKGVDQRVIDELMGHQTEDMRKRYRHLFPEQRENAVKTLFG